MNENQLSDRLFQITTYVPKGARIADIGSDHAYLPCYLRLHKHISFAIAGELNDGPYKLAKAQVERLELADSIDVRKGDGLEVISPDDEIEVVIIAGMGGSLIASILEEGKEKLANVQKLILQPNVGARFVRSWLRENGWRLEDEAILEEDGKIYEIITAIPGDDEDIYMADDRSQLLLGPYLMKEKNETFRKKWTKELENWKRILAQMNEADKTEQLEEKRKQLTEKINMVEEVLQ